MGLNCGIVSPIAEECHKGCSNRFLLLVLLFILLACSRGREQNFFFIIIIAIIAFGGFARTFGFED
jgi:hypothetical protein